MNKLFHIINRGENGVFSTKKEKQGVDMNSQLKSFPQVIHKLWKTYVNHKKDRIIVDKYLFFVVRMLINQATVQVSVVREVSRAIRK